MELRSKEQQAGHWVEAHTLPRSIKVLPSNVGDFNTRYPQTCRTKMVSRKRCLILGLTAFLWVGLHAQDEKQSGRCRLLRRFNLTGYVEAKNHTVVIGGLFPIHSRTIPVDDPDGEPVSAMCEG